jgi:hypothetical protein
VSGERHVVEKVSQTDAFLVAADTLAEVVALLLQRRDIHLQVADTEPAQVQRLPGHLQLLVLHGRALPDGRLGGQGIAERAKAVSSSAGQDSLQMMLVRPTSLLLRSRMTEPRRS